MRILHTSDWHLGKCLSGHSFLLDQDLALSQLRAHLVAEDYDLVIVAGDIFDRPTPSEDAVRMLGAWLGAVRGVKPLLPIVLIAGNHDNGPRLAWTSSLLDHQQVYLRGAAEGVSEPMIVTDRDGEEAEVWAIPFLSPGAMGERPPSQVAAMGAAVERIRAKQRPGVIQVLIAHCFVANGATSDSEQSFVGTATQIQAEQFEGFDYVALGHLHRPQKVAPNARYAGSIARYSFSEAAHGKVALDITVAQGKPHVCVELPLHTLRPMYRITGTLAALRDDPVYADRLGAYVELTLDPPVDEGSPYDELRKRWPYILAFHNDLVSPVSALSKVRDAVGTGRRDLVQDFMDFDAQFPRTDTAPEAVHAAFVDLLSRLPAKEDDK